MKAVGKSVSGTYECRATNPHGCAAYQCTIHVTDPDDQVPGPYLTDLQVSDLTDQNLSINVHIQKKPYTIGQEVLIEYIPYDSADSGKIIAKSGRRKSKDEQKKKKRLSMESLKSDEGPGERLEKIVEPPETGPPEESAVIPEATKEAQPEGTKDEQQSVPQQEILSEAVEQKASEPTSTEEQQKLPEPSSTEEQQLMELLAKQDLQPVAEQQTGKAPEATTEFQNLEEQLKKLQEDLSSIEESEAKKEISPDESFDVIPEEPEEGFELVDKPKESGVVSPSRVLEIPEITLTDASGEDVSQSTPKTKESEEPFEIVSGPTEETAPETSIEVIQEEQAFNYVLTIVEPILFILSADLSGTILSNQKIASISEELAKLPSADGAEIKVMTPGMTKENVIYKWILNKQVGDTEAKDTWILERVS